MQGDQNKDLLPESGYGDTAKIVSKSLELCRKGADELSGSVDELAEKIDGKKGWKKEMGSAKAFFKKFRSEETQGEDATCNAAADISISVPHQVSLSE